MGMGLPDVNVDDLDQGKVRKLSKFLKDAFDQDTWYYLYQMKRGMKQRGEDFRKDLTIKFVDDRITEVTGDFELSEEFNISLDQ